MVICPIVKTWHEAKKIRDKGGGVMVDKSKNTYIPKYFSWCESYEEEEKEFRILICGEPSDVHMLKNEYEQLTGKRFRRRNNE